jgi:glutathione S-transferase
MPKIEIPEIEIYSAALCPFAHRTRLVLAEKGISYKLIEINLKNKPVSFLEISPHGEIPVLKDGLNLLWESAVINEYLDEVFPEPPLLPLDPMQRAQARIWINFAGTRLFAVTRKLLHSCGPQSSTVLLDELNEHLQFMERQGLQKLSANGPFWLGTELSLVDLTFYPWFEQITVLERFRGFQFSSGLERLQQWHAVMTQQASVRSIAQSPDFYLEQYGQLA